MLRADRCSTDDFWAYVAVSVPGRDDSDGDREAVTAEKALSSEKRQRT
jgi:hypothetical protein